MKNVSAVFLVIVAAVLMMSVFGTGKDSRGEVRGVWISYVDYGKIGLANQSEDDFRKNAEEFFNRADELGINTVYFHVRAFRDAAYLSEYFPVSRHIWSCDEPLDYDPLEIMTEMAHDHGMELHAWLNPYRNREMDMDILDPSKEETREEILLCVDELLNNYDIDGIHFDDYFYPEDSAVSDDEKKKNVNLMIREVYETVHKNDRNAVFGISPAGNVGYSRSLGADIETWLSEDGYVDYIIPQIYWTDEHTAPWREDMYTDTLNEWISLNKNDTPMYIGLALYKTGKADPVDPGWKSSSENMAFQIKLLREKDCGGYVFFSASDLFRDSAADELKECGELVF